MDGSQFQDFEYEPGEHDFVQQYFGCDIDAGGIQSVGSVELREGRMITFPNLLLHQLQSFKLEDESREGHLKVLQLSLVEPKARIVGTSDVPAQQRHWWREALETPMVTAGSSSFDKLPTELKDRVYSFVEEFPISLEEAKTLRRHVLAERERYVTGHANTVEEYNGFYLE